MKAFLLLVSILVCSVCFSQPRNIQAKVLVVTKKSRTSVECVAVSMTGDTIVIRYSYRGVGGKRKPISEGTWLSIDADQGDQKDKWYYRRIRVND